MKKLLRPTLAEFWGSILVCLVSLCSAQGQGFLQKQVTFSVSREPLSGALQKIASLGGFYFSYNSRHIPGDSLVSLTVSDTPVREVLDRLVGSHVYYREEGKYIILKPRENTEKFAVAQGRILEETSGTSVDFASVYSKTTLVSTLSGDDGAFKLRIREKVLPIEITVSRIGYHDTTFQIGPTGTSPPAVYLRPKTLELAEVVVTNGSAFQRFFSRMFVSTKLRLNSINVGRFFVNFPYQLSLSPGLGTHGRMSAQVVNKVSVNLLGGYTAGVNGVEIAGGFNINNRDVKYVQIAGLFNVVNGKAKGVQIAGVHNNLIDSLSGVQIAGWSNVNRGVVRGVQLSGVINRSRESVSGVQVAGLLNSNRQNARGVQVSGLINHTKGNFNGVQLGVVNKAGTLRGLQFGVVNIADTTHGLSFGIFNFIKNSPSHLSPHYSDLAPFNLAWKTGSSHLYTILTFGIRPDPSDKLYTYGLGLGHTIPVSARWKLQSEVVLHNFYINSFEDAPTAVRFQLLPNLKIAKRISLVAGPTLTYFYQPGRLAEGGRPPVSGLNPNLRMFGTNRLWLGWSAGVNIYYGKNI
ncbi:hypothetical protein GCM10023091_27070 [Ravibacter arvi]|uniref:Secretin/TonB short N-terminal domain-containing protein n=1 Tax=Ravibacter arvi TaxID=2051041 RepID=A0ABP8M199_9BACT